MAHAHAWQHASPRLETHGGRMWGRARRCRSSPIAPKLNETVSRRYQCQQEKPAREGGAPPHVDGAHVPRRHVPLDMRRGGSAQHAARTAIRQDDARHRAHLLVPLRAVRDATADSNCARAACGIEVCVPGFSGRDGSLVYGYRCGTMLLPKRAIFTHASPATSHCSSLVHCTRGRILAARTQSMRQTAKTPTSSPRRASWAPINAPPEGQDGSSEVVAVLKVSMPQFCSETSITPQASRRP